MMISVAASRGLTDRQSRFRSPAGGRPRSSNAPSLMTGRLGRGWPDAKAVVASGQVAIMTAQIGGLHGLEHSASHRHPQGGLDLARRQGPFRLACRWADSSGTDRQPLSGRQTDRWHHADGGGHGTPWADDLSVDGRRVDLGRGQAAAGFRQVNRSGDGPRCRPHLLARERPYQRTWSSGGPAPRHPDSFVSEDDGVSWESVARLQRPPDVRQLGAARRRHAGWSVAEPDRDRST